MMTLWWIGCMGRHVTTRTGTNTYGGQREWCRLSKRSREAIEMVGYVVRGDEEHILTTEESVSLLADLEFQGEGSYTIS